MRPLANKAAMNSERRSNRALKWWIRARSRCDCLRRQRDYEPDRSRAGTRHWAGRPGAGNEGAWAEPRRGGTPAAAPLAASAQAAAAHLPLSFPQRQPLPRSLLPSLPRPKPSTRSPSSQCHPPQQPWPPSASSPSCLQSSRRRPRAERRRRARRTTCRARSRSSATPSRPRARPTRSRRRARRSRCVLPLALARSGWRGWIGGRVRRDRLGVRQVGVDGSARVRGKASPTDQPA